jgi:hypothetical protein
MEWTDERVKLLKENYEKTPLKELANTIGVTLSAVKNKGHTLGLKRDFYWSVEEDAILKEFYSHKSNKELSRMLGKPLESIKSRATKVLFLKKTPKCLSRTCSKVRGHQVNQFSAIDTVEKAYLLGYTIGDGNICKEAYKLTVVAQVDDIEILHFFKHYLGGGYYYYPKGKNYVYYTISSYDLIGDLEKLGIKPNKSKTVTMPAIETKLMWHLIRGLFDSDGCIYLHKDLRNSRVTVTGNYNICSYIKSFVSQELGVKGSLYKHSQNDTVWIWQLGGRKQLRKFYQFLYRDATIFLSRKHNKFVEARLI